MPVCNLFCSRCEEYLEPQRIWKYRICLKCHAANQRDSRKEYRHFSEEDKVKSRCRAKLNAYIRTRYIAKGVCVECGSKAEAHHPDYSKPFEVVWYCKRHHTDFHLGIIQPSQPILVI